MRKNLFRHLVIVSSLVGLSAHAAFLQGPLPSKEGDISVGAFADAYLGDAKEFQVVGQAIYGLAPRFQIEGRVGGGSIGFEGGAYVKYLAFTSKLLHGALHTGLYTRDKISWDGGFIFGTSINNELEIYSGPILRKVFSEGNPLSVSWAFGADMFAVDALKVYAEFDLKVKDGQNEFVGGVRYFF